MSYGFLHWFRNTEDLTGFGMGWLLVWLPKKPDSKIWAGPPSPRGLPLGRYWQLSSNHVAWQDTGTSFLALGVQMTDDQHEVR